MKRIIEEIDAVSMEDLNKQIGELVNSCEDSVKIINIRKTGIVEPFNYLAFVEYMIDD